MLVRAVAPRVPQAHISAAPLPSRFPTSRPCCWRRVATRKGFTVTPKFLRSEAARFREMAESLTDREASRQRLLAMAIDYDERAEQAEQFQPHEQMQAAPEAASDGATEPESGRAGRSASTRLRLSRTKGGKLALGERT